MQINEAEQALNAKAFDPASVFGLSFSDNVNPMSGALSFTQTDLVLPGRNGLDVQISRSYSSNIFAHINQYPAGQTCTYVNTLCDDCLTPNNIGGPEYDLGSGSITLPFLDRVMNTCSSTDPEQSSFNPAKQLGRGWDMTLGRVKTPAPLLFVNGPNPGDVVPTYSYVSMRGITADTMTIFNNEFSLIWPSMFRQHKDLFSMSGELDLNDYVYWNIAQQLLEVDYQQVSDKEVDADGTCISPATYAAFIKPPYADMVSYYSNKGWSFYSGYCMQGMPGYREGYGTYTLYTDDLSPVHYTFHTADNAALPGGQINLPDLQYSYCEMVDGELTHPLNCLAYNTGLFGPEVVYTSRDGLLYRFENYVPFCGRFDDLEDGNPDGRCQFTDEQTAQLSTRWAQNLYPGTYLTQIKDSFGNTIDIYYKGDYGAGKDTGNPFIDHIVDTYGNEILFTYDNPDGQYDIHTRLKRIQYPNPSHPGSSLYIHYLYEDDCDAQGKPLLSYVYTSENPYPGTCSPDDPIPGTVTHYEYDPASQELVKVSLPTGAIITYDYVWLASTDHNGGMPAYDLTKDYTTTDQRYVARRGVHTKTIYYGGACDRTDSQGGCLWTYDYQILGSDENGAPCYEGQESSNHGEELSGTCLAFTTTDPFDVRSIERILPATIQTKWRDQAGSDAIAWSAPETASAPAPTADALAQGTDTTSCPKTSLDYPYCD